MSADNREHVKPSPHAPASPRQGAVSSPSHIHRPVAGEQVAGGREAAKQSPGKSSSR